MTGRERVLQALTFGRPDRAPRHLWTLPGIPLLRSAELTRFRERFPDDIIPPHFIYGQSESARGKQARKGTYTDEWGCIWEVLQDGVIGEIKHPILADWAGLDKLRPPWEILDADWSVLASTRGASDAFILAGTTVRPFERLQFLRGTENLFLDLAYGTREFTRLKELVHEFFLAEIERWSKMDVDGISFMDDWGSQRALLISPAMWREFFKPLYKEYCDLIHAGGKFVFFHSDGCIRSIIPDLIEIGVDALNAQIFCMDLEDLARNFKGRLTFWGEIDRQHLLPFGNPEEVKNGVRRVRRALDDGRGGVIAQCEWGLNDPYENIEAVFETWLE